MKRRCYHCKGGWKNFDPNDGIGTLDNPHKCLYYGCVKGWIDIEAWKKLRYNG